jgi:hypothetical protein
MTIAQLLTLSVGPSLLAAFVYVAVWAATPERPKFGVFVGETMAKLRAFWGPRLGDKRFLGSLMAVAAGSAGTYLAPEHAKLFMLVLTVAGAFISPTWEDHPFADLDGPRPQ